jgi:hypothetical protein
MSELTVIFASLTVLGHCLVIFWPRKPLQEPIDENGFPIIWCNNDEKQENVACVWRDVAEQPASNLHPEPVHQQSA